MRFIDKRIHKAKSYAEWLLDIGDSVHPKYNSSSFRHYYSIVHDLLVCQNGLCAYTEKYLTSIDGIKEELWDTLDCAHFKFAGQLDHYDPILKIDKGWDWENFFVVDTDVNTKNKRKISPNGILKPDKVGFNPNDFLQYDVSEHIFIPKLSLSHDMRNMIRHDLFVLGINFEPIIQLRKKYLRPILAKFEFEQVSIEELRSVLFQFVTAFEMSIESMD